VKEGYLVIKVIRVVWDLQDLREMMDPGVNRVSMANQVLLESKEVMERKEVMVSMVIQVIREFQEKSDLQVSEGILYEGTKFKILLHVRHRRISLLVLSMTHAGTVHLLGYSSHNPFVSVNAFCINPEEIVEEYEYLLTENT
jgi:hypothetical protein